MAAGADEETRRCFRAHKTTMQMLRDRGYIVEDEETSLNWHQFVERFGDNVDRGLLDYRKSKQDPKDQIYVFFGRDAKFGVGQIRPYIERMKQENVMNAIIVTQQTMTPPLKAYIQGLATTAFHVEIFQEAELLVNISEHELVPRHQLLTNAEKKALLERYTVKETQLPRIQVSDPIARYYGLRRGQVVKITRNSETAGEYVTYRYTI